MGRTDTRAQVSIRPSRPVLSLSFNSCIPHKLLKTLCEENYRVSVGSATSYYLRNLDREGGGNPVVSVKSRSSGAHNRRPPCGLPSNPYYQVRAVVLSRPKQVVALIGTASRWRDLTGQQGCGGATVRWCNAVVLRSFLVGGDTLKQWRSCVAAMVRSGGGAGGGAMQSSLSYCLCLVRMERGAEWRALAASSCSRERRWRARRSDLAGVEAAASSFASHRCRSGHRRRRRKRKKEERRKKEEEEEEEEWEEVAVAVCWWCRWVAGDWENANIGRNWTSVGNMRKEGGF
ncbi:hypothetical protein JCGZ_03213 [Jatropha curcas]|uniref:Uncharacterized protein n=1 Tax=Jatropha curcas TaxID=180498 RepID=A0A067L1H2_JATCU|nr:hypothetical protein JCGZ_03213 [Jatropha curcas]